MSCVVKEVFVNFYKIKILDHVAGKKVIRDLEREIRKKWLFHPTEPQVAVVLDNGSICVLTGSSHTESFEEWSDMNLVDSTRSVVVISWSVS